MRPGEQTPMPTNLIPFERPIPAPPAGIALEGQEMPYDVAALRRPVAVTATAPPAVTERDALAHDARNTMASLALISELLAEPGVLSPEHRHFAAELKGVAEAASTLIGRMARTGAGVHSTSGEPVFVREPLRPQLARPRFVEEPGIDAGAMVEDCAGLLSAVAGPLVKVRIARDRSLGVPILEAEEMTRVLMNLVRNAGEAMPRGGEVSITVRQGARFGTRSSVILLVKDNGPGIPAHALGQIFQAGFTSKQAAGRWPASEHHGLGLAIVRELVESTGGSVRVTSGLGKGTTFELKLPCR